MSEKIIDNEEKVPVSGTNISQSTPVLSPANSETELLKKLQESIDAMNALIQEVRETNVTSSKNAEISNKFSCAVYTLTAGLFLLTIINIGVVVVASVFPAESAELINASMNLLGLAIFVGVLFVSLTAIFLIIKFGFDLCEWFKERKMRKSSP